MLLATAQIATTAVLKPRARGSVWISSVGARVRVSGRLLLSQVHQQRAGPEAEQLGPVWAAGVVGSWCCRPLSMVMLAADFHSK